MLEKWYCDVICNGVVQVHYLANVRLAGASIGYCGSISSIGQSHSRFVPGAVETPIMGHDGLSWPLGGDSLRFSEITPPIAALDLWNAAPSRLTWHPVVSNGNVSGVGLGPNARGYAEVLRMNFGPWHLGLKTLLWGRFCGERHSLIWIVWKGATDKGLALLDGQQVDIESVGDRTIQVRDASLDLLAPQVLVNERLDHGSLKGIPLRGPFARLRFLQGLEEKWHTPAVLKAASTMDYGHAIFERVTWE
jgi:hypothetical protein